MVFIALLPVWLIHEGAGWTADLRPLPSPQLSASQRQGMNIAANSSRADVLGGSVTGEQNIGERQPRTVEAPGTGTRNQPSDAPDMDPGDTLVMADVEVTGRYEGFEVDPTRSRTTVTAKELERRQADNVFTVLQDVPGVAVDGGPLASGMKFNIRGFSDNEDVLMKIDGAMRNFEKYRFGSGVFVEPELLKAVEVTRGPAGALQGSGAIGGVVEMRTKDAADFLRPGERVGARLKSGWSTNNEELMGSASAYGVAFDSIDLLASGTWRDSGDITTASGTKLQNTRANRLSGLGKVSYRPRPGAGITFGHTYFQEDVLQPFDATIGVPGVFGFVRRDMTDSTSTSNFEYAPTSQSLTPWIALKGAFGYTDTSVTDSDRQSANGVLVPNAPTNFFDYKIATFDLTNTTALRFGPVRNALTYGVQYNHNDRTSTINQFNPRTAAWSTVDNLSQPSGTKSFFAYMLEDRINIGHVSLTGSLRHDTYKVEVTAQETRDALQAEGRSPIIEFSKTMPSAGIAWNVMGGPVTLFYNYAKAFRPPLVDEYFTQGAFSRCSLLFFGALTPPSGVCGNLYVPESSTNHEIGVSLNYPGLFKGIDMFTAKLVLYRNDVTHTLESLSARTASGALCRPLRPPTGNNDLCTNVTQDGKEHREGVEFEVGLRTEHWFSNLNISAIRGKQVCDGERPLFDIPGNSLVFSLGHNVLNNRLEYGYRFRAVDHRLVITGTAEQVVTPCNTGLGVGTQAGYVLHNLFASYQPIPMLSFNLAVDNLTNTKYFLNNGFGGGIGQEGMGYNVRFFMSMSF
ncbi:TonB-dependent receptor domain-containing protein [Nitrospira sp. KM1]|uniref:TonB-dependent receptor domain-containing protein n=1 Tax=Nitrospira sp. KM1 TaxID=1936990 RepID=UPI0015650050|nr:TonB-dependent receptor [Nitrospira sp. KM1]